MSDTDTLADLLAEHESRDNYDDGEYIGYICKCRAPESGPYDTDHAGHVAAVVAESGWLRDARAEAWDEGWRACAQVEPDDVVVGDNPYRCHCGELVTYGFDGNPTHTRGMCEHCDAVRCDAYPGACNRRNR